MKIFTVKLEDFKNFTMDSVVASDSRTGRQLKICVQPIEGFICYRVYKGNEFVDGFPQHEFSKAIDCFNEA